MFMGNVQYTKQMQGGFDYIGLAGRIEMIFLSRQPTGTSSERHFATVERHVYLDLD